MASNLNEATAKGEMVQTANPAESFLSLAHSRFRQVSEATQELRRDALDDLQFRIGKQWPDDIKASRNQNPLESRPCLTMNRIPAFLRQVTNEQRQQRPSIQVNPVGDGSDLETSEILQGIIRHIEINSQAEATYDHAFEMMATIGFGYWRLLTEEIDFDTEIKVEWIKNPFTVYIDNMTQKQDKSDAKFGFIVWDLTPEGYRDRYPDSYMASLSNFESVGDRHPQWVGSDFIRIAEYFYEQFGDEEIFRTSSGVYLKGQIPEGEAVLEKKSRQRRFFKWCVINAVEKLEETDWEGKYLPIVGVYGDDLDVDGKPYLAGMVRNAKDPQRMYNYQISAATEASALQPKSPYIVAAGQIEGHEQDWREANIRNLAVLTYNATDVAGKPVPPPIRQSSDTQLASYSYLIRQADNDLKAVTGIYDASLGEKGPDQSGRAILARQKQGDVANLNWTDNLARSIAYTGRILIDLIPRLVTRTKLMRVVNPDQTVKRVPVTNSKYVEDLTAPQGYDKVYDLGVGRYDVSVSVGPTYQSKRQESVASMMAMMNAYPQSMQIAGDLLIRNMDWPGAQQIAERFYKTLPPILQDQDTQDPKKALAGAQGTIQQLQSQLQQAQGLIQQQHEVIQNETVKQQAETEREDKRLATQIAIAKINASKDIDRQNADMLMQQFEQATSHAHEVAMTQMQPPPNGGAAQSDEGQSATEQTQ